MEAAEGNGGIELSTSKWLCCSLQTLIYSVREDEVC